MNDVSNIELSATETETTGLPWPRTWTGAYLFVIASFVIWVAILFAVTESFS